MSATNVNGVASTEAEIPFPGMDGEVRPRRPGSWFNKLVTHTFRRRAAELRREPFAARGQSEKARTTHAIRWASIKSALSGAAAGTVSTGATLFTAETEGLGGIIAGPVAALAIGADMIYRTKLHVDLSCTIASIFDMSFDPDVDEDMWRLYAFTFGSYHHEDDVDDPGKDVVTRMVHMEATHIGSKIGQRMLGESVMRNVIPVVSIVASAVTNYMATQRLGDTVRRAMRYQRALDDVHDAACVSCHEHLDLLIEGMWFIFIADGRLMPEEATLLAHMLKRLDPVRRRATIARFVEDELDWTIRIELMVPESMRDTFFRVLETAAAVDKQVSLPERKILHRAALSLGRPFSEERLTRMMTDLEERGVIVEEATAAPA